MTQLQSISSRLKIQEVCESLSRLANELGPGAKLPTVRKMCQQLAISMVTLNEALRVLEVQRTITRRQGSGVYVSESVHHKTIGLVFGCNIFDGIVSPFYSLLIEHCRQRAALHREQFRFFLDIEAVKDCGESIPVHDDLEDAVVNGLLDGVLMAAHRQDQKQWLLAHDMPVVELGGGKSFRSSLSTHIKIIEMGVAELARQGARSIAMVTPLGDIRIGDHPDFDEDLVAFRKAMKHAGLSVGPNSIWQNLQKPGAMGRTSSRVDHGWQAMCDLWQQPLDMRPDALLVLEDMLMQGMLNAMPVLGIGLNRDLIIATHANRGSPVLRNYEDHLIRLELDPGLMIEDMFKKLHAIFESQPVPTPITIEPKLCVPQSNLRLAGITEDRLLTS